MRYFELAKRLIVNSTHHQHRIAAILVKKNRVIGVGYNLLKTHPSSPHHYKSQHAEFRAIWGIHPADLKGADIYVYREHKSGTPALSKPCPSCQELIKKSGIKKIYYTDYSSFKEYTIDYQ